MKLQLQGGFETYTGQMGVVDFVDGLSTGDVLPIDAIRIGAAIGAVWEDGQPANIGAMYLNNMDAPAHVGMDEKTRHLEDAVVAPKEQSSELEESPTQDESYTEEELAQVADKQGISGLRKIAESFAIEGSSIVGLMKSIKGLKKKATGQKVDSK